MSNSDIAHWDLVHQKTYKGTESHSKYAEEKEVLFPRNSLVVDLGAGTGSDALYFARKGHKVILLDISNYALEKAKERAVKEGLQENIFTQQTDFGLDELPIKSDSADVVYSRISLHYFESNHTMKLFRDIYRILKIGGVAYLTFKSPKDHVEMEYLRKRASEFEKNVFIENGQLRSRFTVEQLNSILEKAGINDFSVNEYIEDLFDISGNLLGKLYLNEVVIRKFG
ncbi:MAG: class I SAM-dependent methyltransferase [Patescibacteria group bacterium]|nr:class I SAM-dependent methyltransferase [Patescibacteria group bacterium]